ncbi:MAG: GPR endopeptidase [Firmicutes bacterium]|nr:GPR endopeptidase [Bacillota bacterium]NSW89323.1 GPR endopeptidase [Bacillota bacterium]
MEQIRNVVTDLAIELRELVKERNAKQVPPKEEEIPGVEVTNAGTEEIKISRVKINSIQGQNALGKPMGNYITIEVPGIKYNDMDLYENTCKALATELAGILNLKEKSTVLVVGLGNWNVTSDSLGPKVVSKLMVTRHLVQYVPEEVEQGVRPVCAIAPGVLGITGIETGEIIRGIVDRIRPDCIIAIDSLASRRLDRVNTTIQIADTGISPGSGVGNKRMDLSRDTLGVPVIAIGVPTVVDAATIANDVIDLVLDSFINQAEQGTQFYNMLKSIDRNEKYQLIQKVLDPYTGNLIVTPKEIDEVIERIAKVIANGINIAVHQGITLDDVNRYLH